MSAYLIAGERVALGVLRRDLAATYATWMNRADVRHGLVSRGVYDAESERGWVDEMRRQSGRLAPTAAPFTIHDRRDDEPVGTCVLTDVDYRHARCGFGILVGERRGQGLGTEAARLALDWAFNALSLRNVLLEVMPWNTCAIRAYEKAGFRPVGRRDALLLHGRRWDELYMDAVADEFTGSVLPGVEDQPAARAQAGMFAPMDGLMMDRPLLIRDIARRAERLFGEREIVSRTHDGIERSTFAEVVSRARRIASSLEKLGVQRGDRVATFGWNSRRHLELYLAVPSMGAVLHTLNIRLFEDDLRYIVDHAQDKVIFLDASLADTMPRFDRVEHEVLMPDADGTRDGALDYEQLVSDGDEAFDFADVDERSAAALCYTSGTTGKPKGVLYSHRSTVLHAIGANQADGLGISQTDSVMPVVPMFHVNAWGLPYIATNTGARLVMPGPRMTPGDLAELIADEHVTFTAGVPTIWQGMMRLDPAPDLSSLKEIVCGGSAVPEALIRGFEEKFGVPIVQAWGMTETSPLASVSRVDADAPEDEDERFRIRATAGRVVPLVDFTIDEEAGGELLVRGPWVASAYFEDDSQKEKFEDGWLRTGDVAELTDGSFLKLVDRTKDLVKSGGEWISSVELENVVMGHPKVMEAAVIAVADEEWGERPCACVVPCEGEELDEDELRSYLSEKVAKWWIPERIEFIDEVPKTSVGKFDKKVLRKRLADEAAGGGA